MLDEEMTMVEEFGDLCFQLFLRPSAPPGLATSRSPSRCRGHLGSDGFAHLRHCPQNRQSEVGDDVEFADLVRDVAEDLQNGLRIQSGTVGGDPLELQASVIEDLLEAPEELQDVLVRGVMVEDVEDEPLETAVVHDREHAEGTVVEFVGGNVSGELAKSPVQVVTLDARSAFFPPTPRPSSEWWRTGRKPGGLARDARRPLGMRDRSRRPAVPRWTPPGGCSCSPATRGPSCPR